MRWRLTSFLIFYLFLCEDTLAQTTDLAFSRNARTFETQSSTLSMKGLASACLTMLKIPDGLPCNPAMTPLNSKASVGIEILLSNGYSALDNVRKLLDRQINQDLVDTLFSKGKIIQVEASADITFLSKYLNGQFTPMSVKGFSVVRNEANPEVDLYTIESNGFHFQSGYELFQDFFSGLQIRTAQRKFIKQRFKLVSLGTQEGKDLLKPKEQTVTYIEPAMTYFLPYTWKPRVSLMVANLGFKSEEYSEIPEPVEAQVGFGFSPPLTWGDLDLSLEYRSMTYEEDDVRKLRLGAMYHFGSMYLTGGLDSNGISGGVIYSLEKINAGIVYSTTQVFSEQENFYTQTVYVQLGWQL